MRYVAIILAFIGLGAITTAASVVSCADLPLCDRRIALDPGHFEFDADTGAVNVIAGATLIERDVNWEVVHATVVKLEELGAEVVILRNDGEFVDRATRYERSARFGAEVLISVHHNGSSDHSVNYSATFYTDADDHIIATFGYQELRTAMETDDGGVWYETFGMTVNPEMPSTLTEAWFITNDEMAERYLREARTRPISWGVGEGWLPGTLVGRESQALSGALLEFLSMDIDVGENDN